MDEALTTESPRLHFTYVQPVETLLKQGDVLANAGELRKVLAEVHPYFTSKEAAVTHFQVLTQSCDLVRRKGNRCSARYITIAAVRLLDVVLQRRIEEIDKRIVVGDMPFCSTLHLLSLRQLVGRLLNNNEDDFFFLRAQPNHGLHHDSCTFLPLSVTLRANEHYEKCLAQKILELREPFQAKLGWKVGNLYARVGTTDFIPGAGIAEKDFDALVDEILSRQVRWVDDRRFGKFRQVATAHQKKGQADLDAIETEVEEKIERSQKSRLDSLVSEIKNLLALDPGGADRVRNLLAQNPLIQRAIKGDQ